MFSLNLPPPICHLSEKKEKILPSFVNARYLYQPGELKGGVRRANDPIWSLKEYTVERAISKPNAPVIYYLQDGPKRGFVREELLDVPPDSHLPSAGIN